jgi:hypothetical protein
MEHPSVRLSPAGDPRAAFEAVGVDPARLAALRDAADAPGAYLTVSTTADGAPALLGSYEVDAPAGVLRFRPRFPLERGVRYRAVLRPAGRPTTAVTAEFVLPRAQEAPTTRVVRVAPSGDVLPENLLKFYVEFSAPMGRGEAYDHVRLLDAAGKPLDLPFLELGEELWDPRGVRLTLLFDPGRIKSGLKPREEMGPVLEAGKTYTLVIDRAWHDAAGNPLAADFRKVFRAGPADTTPPDPKTWTLAPPAAGTRAPLRVTFPEPLDRALLGRVVAVADAAGKAVPGRAEVGDDETSWSFTPAADWRPGRYKLLADRALEDLAGNSIGRPFEVDVFRKVEARTTPETVEVPFTVGPAAR